MAAEAWLSVVAGWYSEPLFLYFVGTTGVALASFFLFGIPYTWIALSDYPALRRYKVQQALSDRQRQQQMDSVAPSLRCLVFNYACSFMAAAASWPLVRLSGIHMQPIESTLDFLFWGVLKLGFAIYFEDLTFYWMHRMLHASTWLYARVHKLHHTYTAPIAINGAYMTAAEQNMIVVGILLPMVLMRAHIYVVWAWMFFRNWETCEEHSGYDFPRNPTHLLPFYEGPSYHDFHHAKNRGNYAALTPLWDRCFGTVAEGYEAYQAEQKSRGAAKRG